MLQKCFTQLHADRFAGIRIRRDAASDHGGIAANILDQANDLRIAEAVIDGSDSPIAAVLRLCRTGDFPAQQCGQEISQIPCDTGQLQLQGREAFNVIHLDSFLP